jgi:subtilisin family serine protease
VSLTSAALTSAADKYHALSGTSQACPHAAGVAALVLSLLPRATPSEVGATANFMMLCAVCGRVRGICAHTLIFR